MRFFRIIPVAALFFAAAFLRAEPVAPSAAPAWRLKDVDGKVISSDQFKGKVVVVDFWATWCGPCRSEMPGYVKLQDKYGKDGLVIIGVSLDEKGPSVVKSFIKENAITYQIVMGDDQIQTAFGNMKYVPTTFLIDRDGIIRDKKIGAVPTEEYTKLVLQYLHEKGPRDRASAGQQD